MTLMTRYLGLSAMAHLHNFYMILIALASCSMLTFDVTASKEGDASSRCLLTKGTWCQDYLATDPIQITAAPQGSLTCPGDCSNRGNCNADTGLCDCMAGWTGATCSERQLRPCSRGYRESGPEPASSVGPDGRDLDMTAEGWTASRCAGWCDVVLATCWCPPNTTYGYIPPPEGSRPGTPPVKMGRMMMDCHPGTDGQGRKVPWGRPAMPWEEVLGPQGWCNDEHAPAVCGGCPLDGVREDCTGFTEAWCPNQCSGHGTCMSGWCACHDGWYGHDCARPRKGIPFSPGLETEHPWLRNTVIQPAEVQAGSRPANRRRPLIYIYDLPPDYNTRIKQYAHSRMLCGWRWFEYDNHTTISSSWTYAIEQLLHEMLLQSEHRTFDPEQADFFYVPVWASCYSWPVCGWTDGPWFHTPGSHRAANMARMYVDAKRWLQRVHPYWNRTGGRDHIFFFSHDEGACWAPKELWPAIMLTHWGRMDLNHSSNTAYDADNYDREAISGEYDPESFLKLIAGHPCYDPRKDLVLPAFKFPGAYSRTPHLSNNPLGHVRDILLLLRGDVGKHRAPNYSRGIRQKLYKLAREESWKDKHNILIGANDDIMGAYSDLLSRSKFCVAAPGDGWSPRLEDSVLHGCIPVIIKDNVHDVFESILELEQFSVRVPEADVHRLPQILKAIPQERLAQMQQKLLKVWHRFSWLSHPLLRQALQDSVANDRQDLEADGVKHMLAPIFADDAFSTMMQWLASRIPATRPQQLEATA